MDIQKDKEETIILTCSSSGMVKESESRNQLQNGHGLKLQPVLSTKFGGSVKERHDSKRLLRGCNDDFYLSTSIFPSQYCFLRRHHSEITDSHMDYIGFSVLCKRMITEYISMFALNISFFSQTQRNKTFRNIYC